MISVCLATCNGEKYLGAQLASILPQLAADDELLIADDSSSDNSLQIARDLNEPRVRLFAGNQFHSPLRNFEYAVGHAEGQYMAFSDQDDIWLPGKLVLTVAKMKELERLHGPATPLLVHTDLQVVDADLRLIAASLWRYQLTDPVGGVALNRLLVQNPVTGCTVMINAALRDLALPIPAGAVMHDWWFALIAAAFGAIGHVPRQTVLYRQHSANDTGARRWGVRAALGQLSDQGAVMARLYRQAGAFLERYRGRLTPAQIELLDAFATMDQAGCVERRRRILKYRFFYAGLLRNVGRLLLG